jgi:ABC-type phosphate transport system substrate-binding protein
MLKKTLTLLAGCFLLSALGALADPAAGFKIVVNGANPVAALSRREMSRLFLKKTTAWPGGQMVQPVDQLEGISVRRLFSREVLERDVPAVKSYWQQMIFSGRSVPPPEKNSDAEVLAYVRANPGAIGYVAAETEPGAGVAVLSLTD